MSLASAGLSSPLPSTDLDTIMTATTLTRRHDHPEITAFSSAKTIDGAQRHIDQEILKFQESVRALRSRRNMLSPVSRLPPEMLSRVFLFCCDPDSLSWIKEVSHVSRHWRAVALACPNLWSFPVFWRPKWADEMLKRSKMAPLTVKADLTTMTPKMVHTLHSSLEQISRIGELDVKTGSRSVPEILNLSDTAPLLHSLSLSSPGFSQEEHFILPDTFLNGEAPRLRRLELTRFFLPWDSSLMANLTHLKVQNPGPTSRPSMPELVEALRRMPMLETLELDNALPQISADVTSVSVPTDRINLSHLKRIVIANASVFECADALNHLSFQTTTHMKISCTGLVSTVAAFSAMISALSSVHGTSSDKPLRTLLVDIGFGGMSLKAWTSFVQTRDLPRSRPLLDIDFKWLRFMRDESEELMAFTCKSMPLQGLRKLSLSTDMHEVGTKTWLSTFGELPVLLTIRLHGQATLLIDALREDVILNGVKQVPETPPAKLVAAAGRRVSRRLNRTESVPGGLFFPALRNLILEDTNFGEPVLDTLENALMERCERKQDLWTLTLNDCSLLLSDDVERLQEIVPDVVWDEIEQGFSDEESDCDHMDDYFDAYNAMGFYDYNSDDYDYPMF